MGKTAKAAKNAKEKTFCHSRVSGNPDGGLTSTIGELGDLAVKPFSKRKNRMIGNKNKKVVRK